MWKTSAKSSVQSIVQQCVDAGMKYVVCSPGSRNAPLLIAFHQHPLISCVVIPDERCAAFFAIGMAQQTNALVGISCTSGSAVLNYYPAIAEAYYQQIPLLVFTADRPVSWVNQGDGQTIMQHDVFKQHVRYSVTIAEKGDEDFSWYLNREISNAIYAANGKVKGPVHINLPFTEPLYNQEFKEFKSIQSIQVVSANETLPSNQFEKVKETWVNAERKMVLLGQMPPNDALEFVLSQTVNDSSVVFLVENTANQVNPMFVQCIDRTLESIPEDELVAYVPDLLIVAGGAVVSKKIKTFLRKHPPKETWKIGSDFLFMDTYMSLKYSFEMDCFSFFKQINSIEINTESTFRNRWKQKDYLAEEKAKMFLNNSLVYSDLSVFHTVLDYIPENTHLHLANSSVVRYAQLFNPVKTIQTWCNRGTSGIDGSSSTALGAAYISKDTWHTLVSGDMSFFYDSNAFWNNLSIPNLRVFLINNGGGGIFKIIPGPSSTDELDDFFVFNHSFSAEHICLSFGISYFKADNIEAIERLMPEFYSFIEGSKPALMEIFTPNDINDEVLKHYFKALL